MMMTIDWCRCKTSQSGSQVSGSVPLRPRGSCVTYTSHCLGARAAMARSQKQVEREPRWLRQVVLRFCQWEEISRSKRELTAFLGGQRNRQTADTSETPPERQRGIHGYVHSTVRSNTAGLVVLHTHIICRYEVRGTWLLQCKCVMCQGGGSR